ncbi:MAG: intein-containing RctB family protein [Candidatus Woesearchaeota archaeon]
MTGLPQVKQVGKAIWEISPDYKKGMNVPARIIATEKLLKEMDQGVFNQVTNVASLPGIVKAAYCMPDGHWGYGFPIGGVAAFDLDEGVISPGGIGFDINCTHPNAKVFCSLGYWKKIKDIEKTWNTEKLGFFEGKGKIVKNTNLLCYMRKNEEGCLYEISTISGHKIKVTGDHPLLTAEGMIKASELSENDFLYIYPFSGVEYKKPKVDIIINQKNIEKVLDELEIFSEGNARSQILKKLKDLGLLEVKYDSPKLPILLKLMGFVLGDGCISFINKRKGFVYFYGKKEDLETIRKDVLELGFSCPNIFTRNRKHKIRTSYDLIEFEHEENSIVKKSTAFAILLVALGVPFGVKTCREYRVPKWIFKAPLWQKRLFLATFFGAELSTPKTLDRYNFYEPQLNMNKLEALKDNGIDFLNDLRLLLSDFGIKSSYPALVEGRQHVGKKGKTCRLRICIHGNPLNLIKLFENIGCEYNKEKQKISCLASNYIKYKETIKRQREKIRKDALKLYNSRINSSEIESKLASEFATPQFVRHSIYTKFKTLPRIAFNFISFEEYKEKFAIGSDGIVKDKIFKIRKIPYNGFVYDVTINDKNHNFIANNFVISNCGMRLLTTNLTVSQVQPKIRELVDLLFQRVPAGVGCKGFVNLNKSQFEEVMTNGVRWCIDNGYGWKEDLERIEENGCIKGADPAFVSEKAMKRGIDQLGTLGSGNHYLEVQMVKADNIFAPEIAEKFGIFKDQIVIMVHCGSRGFGHQIGTDYLRIFEDVMKRHNMKVLDRELACAPYSTEEARNYYKAMACAANMAFSNRQVILHRIRECFSKVFDQTPENLGMHLVYDVAHNIAKIEKHEVDGKKREVIVHRKGSTRAFPPGHSELNSVYKKTGQPVIIGGSMETGSYLLVGTEGAMKETFGSTAHGSGRTMSRAKAKQEVRGDKLQKEMEQRGIYVHAVSMAGLAEEAGVAYKDINEVIAACAEAGISLPVVSFKPLGNIKG